MITLKEWNSLDPRKRKKACETLFFNMPDWYIDNMSKEWHHNLDAEHRLILQSVYKNKNYYYVRVEVVL